MSEYFLFMVNRTLIASWAFILGSSLFVMDALVGLVGQVSALSVVRVIEGLLFLTGSVFLLPSKEKPACED